MPPKVEIPVSDLVKLIKELNGNVSAVGRRLGHDRRTVQARIDESVTAQKALADARDTMLDNAESMLYKKVLEGSTAELIFFLKTQGRNRGYVERNELRHDGSLNISMSWGDDESAGEA